MGWGLGLKNIRQQWRTAKQQLTKYTEHVTQKTNPRAQAPGVCEKTFSTYFVPQPVENTAFIKYGLSSEKIMMMIAFFVVTGCMSLLCTVAKVQS